MTPMDLRAVIIDDEAPARQLLQELISHFSTVKVVGEANSVASGISLCNDLKPNLLFLDVDLGDGEGFDVLEKLAPIPAVIFVTAFDEFAVRAFEVNAIDYLLKPVRGDRLVHALERIVHQPQPVATQKLLEDDQISLRSDSQWRQVYVTEITGVEAEENYSMVHLTDGSAMLIRRNLAEWEKILPKQFFLRAHRSLILNLRKIEKIVMEERDEITVKVAGFAYPTRLGRRAAFRLRKAMRQPNLL
jgi:two-component system LytT family response regulator